MVREKCVDIQQWMAWFAYAKEEWIWRDARDGRWMHDME